MYYTKSNLKGKKQAKDDLRRRQKAAGQIHLL